MQVVNLPVEAQGQQRVSFFGPHPPFCLLALFSESETSPRDVPISASQVLDYRCILPCLNFFFKYGLWVLSSCPQAFKASTSPSELSL